MTHLYLGLLLFSFATSSILVVPFINLLYRLKFQRQKQDKTKDFQNKLTPIFNKFHQNKVGTPIGGGLLIIFTVSCLFALLLPLLKFSQVFISSNYQINREIEIIFITFISFGLLGLYDDILKFFNLKKTGFFGLRMRQKLFLQIFIALMVSSLIYFRLGTDFIYIPFLGAVNLGPLFILVSTSFIVLFANFFNITDGLDGLSCGLLMISLFAFWFLAHSSFDTPISLFISLWLGSLIAFLYFNIFPARIWLGDVGSLSFGATFAVLAMLLGRVVPLIIIGLPFIVEGGSSAIQILSKKYLNRKILPAAPLHLTLQQRGWPEPKIVFRFWLSGIILAIFGLWIGLS